MKITGGSRDWFEDVFEANFDYIRNYLYYLSGDVALSEDLTQDVFVQLWEKRDQVKNETIRPYLFTIARNSFLKSYRRNKTDLRFKSTYFEKIEHESPDFIMEVKEVDERLQRTISAMGEKSRIVFLLNRMDNLTYAQIATLLGISVKTVEKRMKIALATLRREFGETF
ncbi:MAG: RNA polymerase subunit sigma-70 [Draconibacterium sp.]|nr:MAG: RNA polymerase subunit sigma-70 [Draconibacterium sp.]